MDTTLNSALTPGSMNGNLVEFDQEEFFDGDADGASMDSTGFYYIPPNCQDGLIVCKLHIFFHGCAMGQEFIGTEFIETAGFIEIADTNDIVLLFPQVSSYFNKEFATFINVSTYTLQ